MSKRTRTVACDGCRTRKIKCDGGVPCGSCSTIEISCTHNIPRLKKGPKRRRKDTAMELLKAQNGTGVQPDKPGNDAHYITNCIGTSAGSSQYQNGQWTNYPRAMIRQLVNEYFASHHLMVEILDRQQILGYLDHASKKSHQCVVLAMAAYQKLVNEPDSAENGSGNELDEKSQIIEGLLNEALCAHTASMATECISLTQMFGAFFIYTVYFNRQKFPISFVYLRETLTIAQILRIDQESSYSLLSARDREHYRLIYFALLTTERGVCLLTRFPLTLSNHSVAFPEYSTRSNIITLARLFVVVDEYVSLTRPGQGASWPDTGPTFKRLSDQLDQVKELGKALPEEVHRANFLISTEWIRLLLYKSFRSSYSAMSQASLLDTISESISTLGQEMAKISLKVHGVGMAMKLSDVLTAMADTYDIYNIHEQIKASENNIGERIHELLELIQRFKDGNSGGALFHANAHPQLETSLFEIIGDFFENFQFPTLELETEPEANGGLYETT